MNQTSTADGGQIAGQAAQALSRASSLIAMIVGTLGAVALIALINGALEEYVDHSVRDPSDSTKERALLPTGEAK